MADNLNNPSLTPVYSSAPRAPATPLSFPEEQTDQPQLATASQPSPTGLTPVYSSAPSAPQPSSISRTTMTLEQAAESDEEPGAFGKAWDWLNTPVTTWFGIPTSRPGATGFEQGIEEVGSGLLSPLSLGLMIGTFGVSSLFKSAGQIALKSAGMGAEEIATFVKGAELLNKAKAGKGAVAVSDALEKAGATRGLMNKGIQLLTDSGMTLEDITGRHIIQRGGFAVLRHVVPNLVTAQKVSKGLQALVDAGFTGMAAYSVVESSPRVLDALKEGDYDEAARLATHVAAGSLFTALGASQFQKTVGGAGGLAEEALVKAGFKVKPSQENLLLRKNQGIMKYDMIQRYSLADKFEKELHEEFKGIGEKNFGSVMKLMESGLAPDALVEQYNHLAESMGLPERKLPLMPRTDVRPSLPAGNPWLAGAADDFNRTRGARPIVREFYDVDPRSADMDAAYGALKHDPTNPAVKRSYDAYKSEVEEQFNYAAKKLGITFEASKEAEPYKSVSDMVKDVQKNKHLFIPKIADLPTDHPLSELNPRTKLSYAGMSRAVHDLFGHVAEGFGLDARGSENAWNAHRQMFSRAAVPAMTTETRGQGLPIPLPSVPKSTLPPLLQGLASEARKAETFEEFEKDFVGEIKHGRYYHITKDPNFKINPELGPADASSLASGAVDKGKLMITSDLDNWLAGYEKTRPYVAVIDMSEVPRKAYYQVKRGFGNEFFVTDPSKAKVVSVLPISEARASEKRFRTTLEKHITGSESLQKFYEQAKKESVQKAPARSVSGQRAGLLPRDFWSRAEEIPDIPTKEQFAAADAVKNAPKEGFVRLYRGEAPPSGKPIPDWVKQGLKESGKLDAQGRWFTQDKEIAEWYKKEGGDAGYISYVDIPKEKVSEFQVKGVPELEKFSKDPENELFVSKEVAAGRQPSSMADYITKTLQDAFAKAKGRAADETLGKVERDARNRIAQDAGIKGPFFKNKIEEEGFTSDPSEFVGKDFLPEEENRGLFHVTTAKDKILKEGLKSRSQTGQVGLGGGISNEAPTKVSVTFDEAHANMIVDRMGLAVDAAKETISPKEVLDKMISDAGLSDETPEEIARVLRAPENVYEDWDAFDKWFDKEYKPADAYDLVVTLDDALPEIFSGAEEPVRVGFTASKAQMAKIDPAQIGIINIEAKKGAKAEHVGDEKELRFSPKDVRLKGSEKTLEDLQDFGVAGAIKLWDGSTTFSRWSDEMISDYGEKMRPYLKDIYEESRKALFANMPDAVRQRYEKTTWAPNRILDHIQEGKDFAIIQGKDPQSLEADLTKMGYEVIPVEGRIKNAAPSPSFFVPDITSKDAAAFGRAHGQTEIITKEGLYHIKPNPVEDSINPFDYGRLITGEDARGYDQYTVLRGPNGVEFPFTIFPNINLEIPAGAPAKVFLGIKLQDMFTVDELDSSRVQAPSVAGVGTYMTESPQGASALAGETGQVISGVLRPDVKLLEGSETPLPTTVADSVRVAFARIANKLKPDSKPEDVFEMYKNSGSGSLNEPRLTYMDIMHAVRKLAGEKKEGLQAIKGFQAVLAKQGYDGVRFTQAGSGRSILLFPEDVSGVSIQDLLRPAGPSSRLTPDEARAWESPALEDSVRYKELAARQYLKDTKNYTQKEKEELLDSYKQAINATPEMYALATRLRDKFSEVFEEANEKGVLPKSVEDYVTHVWGKDYDGTPKNELSHAAQQDSSFHTNVSMARHRVFKNAFEGQLFGRKLVTDNPVRIAAHEMRSVGEAIAARDFMDRLRDKHVKASDGRSMVALSGTGELVEGSEGRDPAIFTNHNRIRNIRIPAKEIERMKQAGTLDKMIENGKIIQARNGKGKPLYMYNTHDYRVIDHPAMKDWNFGVQAPDGTNVMVKGELRAHPEAYQYLNQILGREKSPLMESKLMKAVLKAGTEAKGILLSFDTFHVIQEGLRALMTGMSPFKIADFDPYDPVLARLVKQGATFGKDHRSREIWQEGNVAGHSKLISKIPLVGDLQDAIQDFLFNKYIPGLKVRAARSLYERYRAANPEWELDKTARVAAADVNERFGGLNYRDMGRSAGTQDFLRLMTLAPDWLESELRFVKRVMTPGGEGQIARQDTIRLAAYLWAAARVMNYMNTGKPHNEAPFGVAVIDDTGKETVYSVRTLPTDMLHFAADPLGFLRGRSSPVVRAGTEIYTGRNNRDQKLTRGQVFVDVLRNAAPIPLQNIGRIAGEAPSDIGTSGQIVKAAGGTAMVYKTQAEKLAAELASDRAEQGPVEPDKLIRHQTLLHLQDELRSGKIPPTTIHQLVEEGQMSVKEARSLLKTVEETAGMDASLARMYSRAARLPMSDFIQIWDAAGNNEKSALAKLLIKKRINYYKKVMTEMSPAERQTDPTYRRLRLMFPNEAPF